MIGWAIETLAASTLLMLVVLALRGPVARRFGAQAAYALWLLPALRMLLPRLPQAAIPVSSVRLHIDPAKLLVAIPVGRSQAGPAPLAAPAIDGLTLGLLFWLIGASLYLGWQLVHHRRLIRSALEHAGSPRALGGIRIRRSPLVSGPLATGILHRHILLPDDFDRRYNPAEQRLALEHELAHHRRGDLVANAAALVMLALHWFNPVAHWAYRAFRADQELACDATVLNRAKCDCRADYGRALIKSAQAGPVAVGACALGPSIHLRRRIMMIAQSRRSRTRRFAGLMLVTAVTGLGLGLTASGSIAAPSRVAPAALQPLFKPASAPQPRLAMAAGEAPARAPSATPAPPVAPASPTSPVAPVPPVPPIAPIAPVPPVPPAGLSAEQVQQIKEAAEQGRLAGEAVQRAMASIDIRAITQQSLAEARAELQRSCTHAKPAPANETDEQAIGRLAAGCVDPAEIQRAVQEGLRAAAEEIRQSKDLSQEQRAAIIAALDRSRAEMAGKIAK